MLGHQAGEVGAALADTGMRTVENPQFASGIASSLATGIRVLSDKVDAAIIVLADMPAVSSDDIGKLVEAFRAQGGNAIVRATASGQRGNPVILPRSLFAEVEALQGDTGARHIVENSDLEVVDIEIGEAARVDVDTPDALEAAGGSFEE